MDPIVEADRRGAILAIVRLGNKDLEIPGEMPTEGGDIVTASYTGGNGAVPATPGAPLGVPMGTSGTTVPTNYISGVTGPEYGMPMCGTPIGLPGPPHVPFGIPAGLRKHVMKNHTSMHIPEPTRRVKVDVRQDPGFSYPKPASHAWIVEQPDVPCGNFRMPWSERREVIQPECPSDTGCAY